jgi:beta-glucosidase
MISLLSLLALAAHAADLPGLEAQTTEEMTVVASTAAQGRAQPNGIEERIEELLKQMTLEEQLDGDADGSIRPEHLELARKGLLGSTLNVRGAKRVNELQKAAVEGARLRIPILFGYDVIHGYRTLFPIPLAEAASFDPAMAEADASIAAAEASAAGVRWTFAPMVDIARDPRWGRIAESSGEDPYLGSVMAWARVKGFQGEDLTAQDKVLACAKHWAAYGAAEAGRDYNTTDLSEHFLRSTVFPPFKAALEAGAPTLMSAFNDLNGVPAAANPFLLTEVLRKEWGFDGFVVSDYTAVQELVNHGLAADGAEAARLALSAGTDMEMVSRLYNQHGVRLVQEGRLPAAVVDEAVRRVLRVKLRAGLFERPYTELGRESPVLRPDHLKAARTAAARSIVLLKNEGGVLPLDKQIKTLAVIGPLADDKRSMLGTWPADGKAEDAVTVLEGIRAKTFPEGKVLYAKGCDLSGPGAEGMDEAVRVAQQADAAVVVLGEDADMSGEAASRASLDLPGRQLELLRAVFGTGTPTVVVLMSGRPLVINWVAENIPAVLEAWHPGVQAGHAVADVLFGDVNPGGKLPATFPRSVGQIPLYYAHKNTGRPPDEKNKYSSKYLDSPVTPLYPFGYGLSYTRFVLSDLRLSAKTIPAEGQVTVSVQLENTGARVGDEVVQLYIQDVAASVTRPVRELRGFERVTLKPGAKRLLEFSLGAEHLGFYDRSMRFVVEPGLFKVFVGTSSVGGLEASFSVGAK